MWSKENIIPSSFLAIVLTAVLMIRFPDQPVTGISLFSAMISVTILYLVKVIRRKGE